MPNRILKESICTSDNLTGLDFGAQLFFLRLTVQCDDFGRFDGRPAILRAMCYPLELDRVSEAQIVTWLDGLESADLVQRYATDGKRYLQIITWRKHQQTRADKSKYPDPPERASTCKQPLADASNGMQPPANVLVSGIVSENENESVSENGAQKAAPQQPPLPLPVPAPKRKIDHSTVPLSEDLDLLYDAYQKALGYTPTDSLPIGVAKQALVKLLNDDRTPADIAGCTNWLSSGGSPPSLMKVCDMMQEWLKQGRPAKSNGNGRKPARRESTWNDAELQAARDADKGKKWSLRLTEGAEALGEWSALNDIWMKSSFTDEGEFLEWVRKGMPNADL
jgi:hypothetical protein